jgi:hypothetical protein
LVFSPKSDVVAVKIENLMVCPPFAHLLTHAYPDLLIHPPGHSLVSSLYI